MGCNVRINHARLDFGTGGPHRGVITTGVENGALETLSGPFTRATYPNDPIGVRRRCKLRRPAYGCDLIGVSLERESVTSPKRRWIAEITRPFWPLCDYNFGDGHHMDIPCGMVVWFETAVQHYFPGPDLCELLDMPNVPIYFSSTSGINTYVGETSGGLPRAYTINYWTCPYIVPDPGGVCPGAGKEFLPQMYLAIEANDGTTPPYEPHVTYRLSFFLDPAQPNVGTVFECTWTIEEGGDIRPGAQEATLMQAKLIQTQIPWPNAAFTPVAFIAPTDLSEDDTRDKCIEQAQTLCFDRSFVTCP